MSLFTRDYDYALPETLIAQHPPARREDSRMMILDRTLGTITHGKFEQFPTFLHKGDLVVLNDTKVIPARLLSGDRRTEVFLLEQTDANTWKCFVRPGRKLRPGRRISIAGTEAEILEILPDGERIVRFDLAINPVEVGQIPLPPYVRRPAEDSDFERYQTVYASSPGAVAAPTAGLHFTPEMLASIAHVFVTLHVGAGTFKPVQEDALSDHKMHSERFIVPQSSADAINSAQRIVAVGTTTLRVLESCADSQGQISAGGGRTDIFIHPPYVFKSVRALLTNFHLPQSTLLMLVCAFGGMDLVLRAYEEAVRERYRFYSYGDCMLLI